MKIAFLGLGNMGIHMAHHLLKAGHDVTVWNRTESKADQLKAEGAKVAPFPAEAARGAQIAITMLADDQAVEQSVQGGPVWGILEALPKGAVHISCSTISVALSQRLAKEHSERGQEYIAARCLVVPKRRRRGSCSLWPRESLRSSSVVGHYWKQSANE